METHSKILFLFSAIVLVASVSSDRSFSPESSGETLRNMVLSNPYILVGSSANLYRLTRDNLEVEQSLPLTSPNRLLVTDPSGTYRGKVLHCGTQECRLSEISNVTQERWSVMSGVLNAGTENVVGIFGPGPNGTSALTYGEQPSNNMAPSRLAKGELLLNTTDSFNIFVSQIERDPSRPREFLTAFTYQNYIYLVMTVRQSSEMQTRVVRLCLNDAGRVARGVMLAQFTSYFEIVLECSSNSGTNGNDDIQASSATFVNSAPFSTGTLLVATGMSTGTDSVIDNVCAYNLFMINELLSERFENCIDGSGVVGIERNTSPAQCLDIDEDLIIAGNISECNLVGVLQPGLEVDEPNNVDSNIIISQSTGGFFTSIVHTSLDGSAFLFAGTSEGLLFQYHLINEMSSSLVRSVNLTGSSSESEISQLLAADSGEFVYALTPNKLFQHSVDQCHTYTTCEDCVSSSDPICGWCTLERRCTRQSNCRNLPIGGSQWRTEVATCPVISLVNPNSHILYFDQLTDGFAIELSSFNIPMFLDYQCVFDFGASGMSGVDDATRGGNTFSCEVPNRDSIPDLVEGEDTAFSNVSLRFEWSPGDVVDFVTLAVSLGFTDCSVHSSCADCISSAQGCSWCPLSFHCIPRNLSTASCDGNEPPVMEGCPSIRPHPVTTNYLLHINIPHSHPPLNISAQNLSEIREEFNNNNFMCVVCGVDCTSEELFRLPASLNDRGDLIHCSGTMFPYSGPEPLLNVTLNVVWTGNNRTIDNPENTQVTLYSCDRMGTNCAQCLSIDPQFRCSYCRGDGNCILEEQIQCEGGTLSDPDSETELQLCGEPVIESFSPISGPIQGGTEITINGINLGARREQVESVTIAGSAMNCMLTEYIPGVRIKCVTSPEQNILGPISIIFTYRDDPVVSLVDFSFLIPSLVPFPNTVTPTLGPRSGGTPVTIFGNHLDIGSSRRVIVATRECIIETVNSGSLTCVTTFSPANVTSNVLEVRIDEWRQSSSGFSYEDDPTFGSIAPQFSFAAGGTNYTVMGTNLHVAAIRHLLFYFDRVDNSEERRKRQTASQEADAMSEPCLGDSTTEMFCSAPAIVLNSTSIVVSIGLLMDGVASLQRLDNTSVIVNPNPRFNTFEDVMEFSENRNTIQLTIQGEGFLFRVDQVAVGLSPCSGECQCDVRHVFPNNNTLVCVIENPKNLGTEQLITVTVHLGNLSADVGQIRITEEQDLLVILVPTFAGVLVIAGAIFIVVVALFCRKQRQKDQRYDQLILELEKLESSVARECKLGFAELQTDLDELTGDITGCRLPYHDLQTYMLANLFPGARDHPIMHELQLPRKVAVERALRDFHDLLLDKKVLLTFIRSMEEQRGFTIRDKSIVGSLLMVSLHNRLDYATEILKSLLSELIRKTVTQSYPKLLLRRTESVAERMLTNWLAFCLHGYLMEHAGQHLYLLYKAVKSQLEKGPVDVITGEARYSLSEQKLIRQKMDVEVFNATVETEDGLRIPVKLLDCDTISQTKEKLLDAVYKAAPVSQRPALTSVDIVYLKSSMEHHVLRDEDFTTMLEYGWKRINTLRHYGVMDGAAFRLIPRKEHAPPGRTWDYPASLISTHCPRQRALSEAEDGTRVWHLFKQLDVEDPKRSPFLNKKMVTEIYLPRMLSTKTILQKFVDDLFRSLFSLSHPPSSPSTMYSSFFPNSPGVQVPMGYAPGADAVPMAVKYLFDYLDDEAENARINDPDVVHTWKNNALSLRFWVNMIKNPEFIFDIHKSHTVDACLSVIAQAFIDGCSSAEVKLNIDSPTSKLLYNKEVQGYKAQVRRFYEDVHNLPRVPEDAMQYYLKQLSTYQTQLMRKNGGFVTESALYELLRYGIKYHEVFLSNLRAAGLESKAQMFEGILRVTM